MNSNIRLVTFVTSSFSLYLIFSILGSYYHLNWTVFKRINLISEIITQDSVPKVTSIIKAEIKKTVTNELRNGKNIDLYNSPNTITDFNRDTNKASLVRLMKKLNEIKNGTKRKIRIAYFGDSMIEGDLLTQTFRKLVQAEFGGGGVGYVPITCPTSKFRLSVTEKTSGIWDVQNFKTSNKISNLFLSGYLFKSQYGGVEMYDRTIQDSNITLEKTLFYGYSDLPVSIKVNGSLREISPREVFGKVILSKDNSPFINIASTDSHLPIYGISFETESGVTVDNFSFRGISGVELNSIDTTFLNMVASKNSYDLIIFQYGINVLFRPHDKNFNWYAKMLAPVIKKFKNSFKDAECLIISTSDRAFRYNGEYKSAEGIDSLIKTQATLAYETGTAFYNQFETMGGHNSIVSWVNAKPSLANKDYIHPNPKGAEILGTKFFMAFMKDYNKYIKNSY